MRHTRSVSVKSSHNNKLDMFHLKTFIVFIGITYVAALPQLETVMVDKAEAATVLAGSGSMEGKKSSSERRSEEFKEEREEREEDETIEELREPIGGDNRPVNKPTMNCTTTVTITENGSVNTTKCTSGADRMVQTIVAVASLAFYFGIN